MHTSIYTQLISGGKTYQMVDLQAILAADLERYPYVLRLLIENIVRHSSHQALGAQLEAFSQWLRQGNSREEIAFYPNRILMHDTTSTPALVDFAAMRDELAEAGLDPSLLNPVIPVEVSVDHSLAVEAYARTGAARENMRHEIRRNAERYQFLRWASNAFENVHVNPPGTGIMHTINLEQLATVVTAVQTPEIDRFRHRGGDIPPAVSRLAIPDMMIGTDSHTPMINGLGVLGWGVGGLEAQMAMLGLPLMQRIPEVIGVHLVGALRPGVLATDLALTVTHRLRQLGVAGEFVEFFGPGVSSLSAGERCVVANMAPEYGATTGYFPIDEQSLAYLRTTGRQEAAIELVRDYAQQAGLWFAPENTPRYTRTLEIDLAQVEWHVAGPQRPQDLWRYSEVPTLFASSTSGGEHSVEKGSSLPPYPIAIAAITSCTNTSDPYLLVAAGLLAQKAHEKGLTVPPWVKTSLAPGSPAAARYLERAGLTTALSAVGFDIVGFGCATCIGNSGPLPEQIQQAMQKGQVKPVAVLSGNRNFSGRVHHELDLGLLMSPPLVVAYALVGDAQRNLHTEALGVDVQGAPIYLTDIWPTHEEVQALVQTHVVEQDFAVAFSQALNNPLWAELDAPTGVLYPWQERSNALRRPPFASRAQGSRLGSYSAYPLLVLGDDITTDHISPASAIPKDSYAADYLVQRGENRDDLNVFASRRGNWEVMVRGAFYAQKVENLLCPQAPTGHTLHIPSGDVEPLWEVAQRYQADGDSVVLIAGERFGTGSSRDWAAKVQSLLGVRAVLALSFERIHRTNLIGMGILPLTLPASIEGIDRLAIGPKDRIIVEAEAAQLSPQAKVHVQVQRADGRLESIWAKAEVQTELELNLLRCGGAMPYILTVVGDDGML